MNTFKRYLKLTFIGGLIGIVIAFSASTYISYQLDKEMNKYVVETTNIKELSDTYYLCLGLFQTTRAKQDRQTCNYIKEKILAKSDKLESELTYNRFVQDRLKK